MDEGVLGLPFLPSIATAFGPQPRDKLLLTATKKAVLTSSGASIISSLVTDHPLQRLVLDAAAAHSAQAGDGSKAFLLLLDAALRDAHRQLVALPAERRQSWRLRLSRAACWLAQEVVPNEVAACLRRQAVRTAGAPGV